MLHSVAPIIGCMMLRTMTRYELPVGDMSRRESTHASIRAARGRGGLNFIIDQWDLPTELHKRNKYCAAVAVGADANIPIPYS